MNFFKKSVVRVILLVLVIVFYCYNTTVLIVMHKNIMKEFTSNMLEEVIGQSSYFLKLFDDEKKNTLNGAEYAASFCGQMYEKNRMDIEFLSELEKSVINKLGVNRVIYFDKDSNFIIEQAEWAGFEQNYATAAIQSKSSVAEILNYGGYIVAMSAAPIIVNNNVVGAVSTTTVLTTAYMVQDVNKYTLCDATIFTGTVREQTSLEGMRHTEIDDPTIIERVMAGEDLSFSKKINGIEYVSHYFALKDSSGNPVTVLFLGKTLASVKNISTKIFTTLTGLLSALFMGFLFVFIFLMNRTLKKPLKDLEKQVENLASGEIDLNARMHVKGKNEFARIGNFVNTFIENLQEIIRTLNQTQSQITGIGFKLSESSQESASATSEILANISGINKQSKDQAEAVNDTSSILEQSAETFNDLNNMIEGQVNDVSESSAAIEEMIGNIESVTSSVHKMAGNFTDLENSVELGDKKLKDLDIKVGEIAGQSEMLKDANSIISNIAEQTNLLAMNAAIEAAHAGEAGKGFSVVADEIRKLAETSSAQSKNISSELQTISDSISEVVDLSKESQVTFTDIFNHINLTNSVIKEIDSAMNEQHDASRLILNSLDKVKTTSNKVEEKSTMLKEGMVRVTGNMDQVKTISENILGSMTEMTSGATQINENSQSVSDLASETRDQLGVMSELLASFKN